MPLRPARAVCAIALVVGCQAPSRASSDPLSLEIAEHENFLRATCGACPDLVEPGLESDCRQRLARPLSVAAERCLAALDDRLGAAALDAYLGCRLRAHRGYFECGLAVARSSCALAALDGCRSTLETALSGCLGSAGAGASGVRLCLAGPVAPGPDAGGTDAGRPAACAEPTIPCDGMCVEPWRDPRHCGGCGVACPDTTCVDGRCACPAPTEDCGADGCVDTSTDPAHCGACGVACEVDPEASVLATRCAEGECRVDHCAPRRADCDGLLWNGCEAQRTFALHDGTLEGTLRWGSEPEPTTGAMVARFDATGHRRHIESIQAHLRSPSATEQPIWFVVWGAAGAGLGRELYRQQVFLTPTDTCETWTSGVFPPRVEVDGPFYAGVEWRLDLSVGTHLCVDHTAADLQPAFSRYGTNAWRSIADAVPEVRALGIEVTLSCPL